MSDLEHQTKRMNEIDRELLVSVSRQLMASQHPFGWDLCEAGSILQKRDMVNDLVPTSRAVFANPDVMKSGTFDTITISKYFELIFVKSFRNLTTGNICR